MASKHQQSAFSRKSLFVMSDGITGVELRFGFMEQPNVTPATRRSLLWAGGRAWRAGARSCSRSSITTPGALARISKFQADGSWKSASGFEI
jgi:hypothetical protein